MKTIVFFIVSLFFIQLSAAQFYSSKAVKIATRSDAYPYGQAKVADVDVVLDIENRTLKVSNFPDYCFNLEVLSEHVQNNGKLIRLSSICPKHKKCYVNVYIENDQIISMEIKFVTSSYMYHLASR